MNYSTHCDSGKQNLRKKGEVRGPVEYDIDHGYYNVSLSSLGYYSGAVQHFWCWSSCARTLRSNLFACVRGGNDATELEVELSRSWVSQRWCGPKESSAALLIRDSVPAVSSSSCGGIILHSGNIIVVRIKTARETDDTREEYLAGSVRFAETVSR